MRTSWIEPAAHWRRAARRACLAVVACAFTVALPDTGAAQPLGGTDFPEITPAERALTEVEIDPGADFVVLRRHGEFWMMDQDANRFASTLVVHWRAKVLASSGAEHATFDIPHNVFVRLDSLRARTLAADGSEIAAAEDDVQTSLVSERFGSRSTRVIFPRAEPGAILDLTYTLRYGSILFLEPWLFQGDAPVLSSRILFHVPEDVSTAYWTLNPSAKEIQVTADSEPRGRWMNAELSELPALPLEPHGLPLADLSAQCMLIPISIVISGQVVPLFEDWRNAIRILVNDDYSPFLGRRRQLRQAFKELGISKGDDRGNAERLLRWARDEIAIAYDSGVAAAVEDMDTVLERGEGSPTERALILSAMLDQAGIDAVPVWVSSRHSGRFDPNYPNPGWFDRVILQAELDREATFLDPLAEGGPGHLDPGLEGSRVVIADRSSPRIVELPVSAAEDNRVLTTWRLEVTAAGAGLSHSAAHGTLTVLRTGHAATSSSWWPRAELGSDAIGEVLEEALPRWTVSEIEIERSPSPPRLEVKASVRLDSEEALPDEFTWRAGELDVELPRLAGTSRRGPILLPFRWVDEVVLELSLPQGWELERTIDPKNQLEPAGALQMELGRDGDRIRGRWRLALAEREAGGAVAASMMRLFAAHREGSVHPVAAFSSP